MQRQADMGRRRRRVRATTLAVATLAALGALLAGSHFAAAVIEDPYAEPGWVYQFTGPEPGGASANDVAVTATTVWVAGSVGTATGSDATLARIRPDVCEDPVFTLWGGAAEGNDYNLDIAVRGSYVYTSGIAANAANDDLLVIRWASSTGAVKWVRRYNGPARKNDEATDVAVDAKGNVVVCGWRQTANLTTDWVVLKYGPDGTKKWTWTYAGPGGGYDYPIEMVVDGAGNIYVTGRTQLDGYVEAAYTVKLSPGGDKLWGRRYRGPEKLTTFGDALVLRPGGGVYAGGTTTTTGTGRDMYVVRYSGAGVATPLQLFTAGGGATAQDLQDLAVASDGQVVAVGQHEETDPVWARWSVAGNVVAYHVDATAGYDWWEAVTTDKYGGVYMAGRYGTGLPNQTIRFRRLSVVPRGGTWTYDYAPDTGSRSPEALALHGTTLAVVGHDYTGGEYQQFVKVWRY